MFSVIIGLLLSLVMLEILAHLISIVMGNTPECIRSKIKHVTSFSLQYLK